MPGGDAKGKRILASDSSVVNEENAVVPKTWFAVVRLMKKR
jgi:hypothetical protein